MVSASDGWAVGVSGTFFHWNGIAWNGASIFPGVVLNDVDMVTASDGWAVRTGGACTTSMVAIGLRRPAPPQ